MCVCVYSSPPQHPTERGQSELAKETQNFNTFLHGIQNSVPIQLVTDKCP